MNLDEIPMEDLKNEVRRRELEAAKKANIAFIRETIEMLEDMVKNGVIDDRVRVTVTGWNYREKKWTEIRIQR